MGKFVCNNVGNELPFRLCRIDRVNEKEILSERDAPKILHRPGGEIGECEQFNLVARIRNAVVVLKPLQAELCDVESELGEMSFTWYVHEPQRDAIDVTPFGGFKRSNNEGDEIRAHHHRVGKCDCNEIVCPGFTFYFGRV